LGYGAIRTGAVPTGNAPELLGGLGGLVRDFRTRRFLVARLPLSAVELVRKISNMFG
jgi:hypothetical protein